MGILMSTNGTGVRMSVRILDEKGSEIASFFSDTPEGDEGGFSASLRDALLAFRKKYPNTHFIDVEFKGMIDAPTGSLTTTVISKSIARY
jgi:hypothetical protein